MSLFAGKRGAKVTTDIADKGKQWFFTSLPQSPTPHPPNSGMGGTRAQKSISDPV